MTRTLRIILFIAVSLLSFFYTKSQEDSAGRSLDEVIITANRFPQKQQSTGKVLTIIPRSAIERNAGRSVGEILNQQAGITVAGANNTPGTNPDVYMRGAATGNALIVIDGVPVYDHSTIASTFDLNHFPLDNIERIEILKGAQSTLYGSDAVAGVIHIITRKKGVKPIGGSVNVSAGSFNTYQLGMGLYGSSGKSAYQVQYLHHRSSGISSALDSTGKSSFDRDGFMQHMLSANYSLKLTDRLEWRTTGRVSRYNNDLDAGAFSDEKDFNSYSRNFQAGTGLHYTYNRGSVHVTFHQNSNKREYTDDSLWVGGFAKFSYQNYKGRSGFAELYANHRLNDKADLIGGVDYRWQNTDQLYMSVSDFGPYESRLSADSARATIFSVYGSVLLKEIRHFNFETGARFNMHSRFGNQTTFTINPSWQKKNWKIFVNLSSAFKAPSLFQLFDAYSGQPELKAEKSVTLEGGTQFISEDKKWKSRVVFFFRNIRDGIDYSYVDYRYFNNNRQEDHGIEWEAFYEPGKWQLGLNYTYLNGNVNTVKYKYDPSTFSYVPNGDTTFNNLFRRPRHRLNATAGYQVNNKLYLGIITALSGKRYEPVFQGKPVVLEAYHTLDLQARYSLTERFSLYTDLKNVFNRKYTDIGGYGARGFHFIAGLRYSIN